MKQFAYDMQSSPFGSQPISEELIRNALKLLLEDTDNFFVLDNLTDGTFMQTVIEEGKFRVEFAPNKIYVKFVEDYEEAANMFVNYFNGILPDILDGFEDTGIL